MLFSELGNPESPYIYVKTFKLKINIHTMDKSLETINFKYENLIQYLYRMNPTYPQSKKLRN